MTYTNTKRVIIAWMILYPIISYASDAIKNTETYPFFSWRLFDTVPNTKDEYMLKLTSIDGHEINPPIYYLDRKDIIVRQSTSASLLRSKISQYALALISHNKNDITLRKEAVISSFTVPVTFLLVKTRYTPLEFFAYKRILSEKIISQEP